MIPCHGPTLAGFLVFLRQSAGFPATALPDNSPTIPIAYAVAHEIVNYQMRQVSKLIYTMSVYNLGASNVVNYAQDVPGAPTLPVGDERLPFFAAMRANLNLNSFVSGVISNSFDNSTGAGFVVPDQLKSLSLADLQYLKDPWGRQYLAFAQRAGTLWGVS